ncbi:hypothetical protein M9H77_31891 [Catharanthus roseus]|uniref:Uncharacterized protein n=1 Tax=Catharanthus roseus TaxID=4058 RepID=A0ACC0A3F7_CATRO|nr:hypothetical protein M9H77_31891 [Catharanthus roseus]
MVSGYHTVYIGNPTNHNTHSVGYQSTGIDRRMMTSMLQEVDDMASVVIQEPPSSPSQMVVFAKKVQTIIRRCMVSIGSTLGCTLLQHNIQQTFSSLSSGSGTLQMPPPPGLGFAPFQSPHSTSFGFSGFVHPLLRVQLASTFDEEERTDDMNVVQHYRFEHRVGKKTMRFTLSDWP